MGASETFTLNIKALFDASDVRGKLGEIQRAFGNLKLPNNLGINLKNSFSNVEKALIDFETQVAKGVKTKADASGLTRSMDKVITEFTRLSGIVDKVKGEINSSTDLSKISKLDEATITKLNTLKKDIESLQSQINTINTSKISQLEQALSKLTSKKASQYGAEAFKLFKEGDIDAAIKKLNEVIERYTKLSGGNAESGRFSSIIASFKELKTAMEEAKTETTPLTEEIGRKTQQMANETTSAMEREVNAVNSADGAIKQYGADASAARGPVTGLANDQQRLNSELDQVKSRIKYLLGLNNAFNLIRRGIRSAFNTVKELDKAMTETAVVTDMTVSDMWAKLPEYTARANKLGISTLEAYQAATLYYQQGLDDTQVSELSVETLRMARIAGLEAAEATDRMTNALRGFNMELNATNAQRVDDVYSKLAAMSASNVDEISTAMTKVASLAHNANMDFETTAAFLAQIIETTRESAETAGTALKTVVARFSEVKKLVTEDQIKGQDEEGQVIDVNKVSAALRTAGIDLNKYFAGEVGLDDIFMELAEKWDSLTSVQQRYIATQAAGSRQQSRFIAMMQDYARTQELVSAAYNANGASAEQFEKTQDSLQSKLARLKNAWNEFLMGITNSSFIKIVVSGLTGLLNIVNQLTTGFGILTGSVGSFISGLLKLSAAVLAFKGLRTIFKTGGIASKMFASFGQSRVGGFLGFGGSTTQTAAQAGAGFKAQVATAGQIWQAAVAKSAGIQTTVNGTNTSANVARLTLGQRLQQFKSNSLDPRKTDAWKLDPNYLIARRNYQNSPSLDNLKQLGQARQGAIATAAVANTPKTLFGALGNRFIKTGVGGKISKGLGAGLGKLGIGTGAALGGAATLATTLGVVAVAGFAAYKIIKAIYDASPAGQLKAAKKYAEALKKVSENAKKVASEMKEAKTKTEDYEKQISEATNIDDRRKLIQEQNEYITSLMEQDERYAKYVTASYEGGELHLTLDSEAFTAAVEEAQNAATRASALSNLANAEVQEKQVAVWERDLLKDVDLENRTYTDYVLVDYQGETPIYEWQTVNMTDRQYREQAGLQSRIDAAEIAADAYRSTAITQLASLYNDKATGEQLGLIADVFTKNLDWDAINEKVNEREDALHYSDSERRAEYYRLYGVKLEDGYDKDEVYRSIAYGQVIEEEINSQIPGFIDIAKDANGQAILQVLAGTYEGEQEAALDAIQQILQNEDYVKALSSLLDVSEEELEGELISHYDQLMSQYQYLRDTLSSKLLRAGLGTYAEITATVQKLSIKQVKQLSKYADKLSANYSKKFSSAILGDVTAAMYNGTWDGSYLQQLVNNISDNPILALQELTTWAEKGNDEMQALANKYLDLAKADSTFSRENLTKWFFMSDEYDKLTEQINKFIEENGQINSHNIEELAKNSEVLQAMLDTGTMSANGLANAINALSKGNIGISDLTDEIIGLYEAFDNTANAIQRAGYYIKNFDPGEDYGDAIDFINNGIEQMQQFLNNGEIGNPQFQRYMKAFFNELPDQDDIAGWQERIDLLRQVSGNNGADFWTDFVGFNREGNFIDMDTAGFAEDIQANSYRDYIKSKIPEEYRDLFSDEFYDMMIRNAAAHDAGAFEEIAQIELDKLLNAYKTTEPTKADIQAIANAYGLDPEKLYQAWKDKHPEYEGPNSFVGLQEKRQRSNYNGLDYLANEVFGTDEKVQIVGSGRSLESGDINDTNVGKILGLIGVDETGHFSIDHLYAEIGEVVPEVENGSISAEEWLQEQIDEYSGEDGKVTIPVTAQVTQWDEDTESFHYVDVEFNITGGSVEELEASYYANLEKQSQDALYGDAASQLGSEVQYAVQKGIIDGAHEAFASLTIPSIKVPLEFEETSATLTIGGGQWPLTVTAAAKGGIVKSAAGGAIQPGLALTGEEAPEIVWNKEKGYAYLAGKNGPEINNLQPGDQVFDGEQTRQILKRSGISSFAKGTINSYSTTDKKSFTYWTAGGGKEGASGDSSKSSKDWENELDWLYDLMEDIAEEEHKQTLIQSEYELAEKDLAKTGRDLYNLTRAELDTLQAQLSAQQFAFEKRLQQMNELQQKVVAEGFEEYLRWNSEDNSLEIDWDKINEITDKDTYDKLSDLVSDMEKVQDQMDEAQEATLDIKKQIQELQTRYLQAFLDFQNKVMEAVVAQYQQNIDSLSELNDTINEANKSILDSIQKEIDLQRQIRDNTDTEKEIADMEARLAMLQRDTTGANQQEILKLQKQLDEARKNYSDTLTDQAIDRLSQNNDDAQEQREKQIELLEAQLEYWQETGALWEEVAKLIADGFTSQGSIIQGSELWEFLKNKDSWNGLSEAQKVNWANDLIREANQVGAYFYQFSDNGTITAQKIIDSIIGEHGLAGEIAAETRIVRAQLNELIATLGGTPIDSIPGDSGYASGGLATKTGLAMLHGTTNEPEYVLNARQTGAFLRLADVLPSIFGSGTGTTNNYGTNVYVELNMSVGEIGSDYDVDRLVARVKDDIYDASSYRNVNAVSFLR